MVLCYQSTFEETTLKNFYAVLLFFVNLFQMFQTQASRRHCTRNIVRPKSAPSLSSCNFYLISSGRRDTLEAIFRNIQSLLSYIYHIIFQLVKIHLLLIIRKENAGLVHAWCVSHASRAPLPTMKQACKFFFPRQWST